MPTLPSVQSRRIGIGVLLASVGLASGWADPPLVSAQDTPANRASSFPTSAELPRALTERDLEALTVRVVGRIVRMRATQDLGPGYRPRLQQGDGYAVWLLMPDDPDDANTQYTPILITTWSWLANAQSVEVQDGDRWLPATIELGGPTFDLARVQADLSLSASPLSLAAAWPMDGLLFGFQPPQEGALDPRGSVISGAQGAAPAGDFAYYLRSLVQQRNGLPVFNRQGEVLAIASFFAPDGRGSLAIGTQHLREWWSMRDRLDSSVVGGVRPLVRTESLELSTGSDAITPGRQPGRAGGRAGGTPR